MVSKPPPAMVIAEEFTAVCLEINERCASYTGPPCSVDRVICTPSLGQVNQLCVVVPIGNPPHADSRGVALRDGCDAPIRLSIGALASPWKGEVPERSEGDGGQALPRDRLAIA